MCELDSTEERGHPQEPWWVGVREAQVMLTERQLNAVAAMQFALEIILHNF